MTWRAAQAEFTSFDGSTRIRTHCFTPDRYRFWDARGRESYGISRGAGLSYAAASFSSTAPSIAHRHLNRLLDFDSNTNLLEVEAGATLGHIYDFAVQRNLFLSVQPGHPRITVGGCIGADVHGKNQFRDGTFLSRVESLRLFHPDHGILELSREQDPELFALTCGGYGLTGNILSARIRLTPVPGVRVRIGVRPAPDIFTLAPMLSEAAATYDLVYTWHDFMSRGTAFGQGFLITGSFSAADQARSTGVGRRLRGESRLTAEARGNLKLPFFNRLTTRIFNAVYRASLRRHPTARLISLWEFLFPVHNKELYFRLFGARGFNEYQMIVPAESFESFLRDIQRYLERNPLAITLASAKLFRGRRELLRFTGDGICLALDFPRPAGLAFAGFLDQLLRSYGGWPNIIKDSRLTAVFVSETYPGYYGFRDRLRQFDPKRLYRSELSERLAL